MEWFNDGIKFSEQEVFLLHKMLDEYRDYLKEIGVLQDVDGKEIEIMNLVLMFVRSRQRN